MPRDPSPSIPACISAELLYEVKVRDAVLDLPKRESDAAVDDSILKFEVGEAVPIPTLPVFNTEKSVLVADAVEEPIAKSVVLVSPLFACTESFANGEVEPIPTFPPAVARYVFPVVVS